jgi:hypothetical protein
MYTISTADCTASAREARQTFSRPDHAAAERDAVLHGDVIFGSPRDDCRGTGICKIVSRAAAPAGVRGSCQRARAVLRRDAASGGLLVRIDKGHLCAHLMHTYFRHRHLEFSDACLLDACIAKALGLDGVVVCPGRYALTDAGPYVDVVLRVI